MTVGKREPAVLLVSPGILKWQDLDFGLPHLVSLGGYLRAHTGVRVEIVDLNYEGGDHRSLGRTLDALGPFLLIGVSTYSSFDRMRSVAVARFLRERYPGVPVVTGGYHASAVPEDLWYEGGPFDAVVVGEAEEPLLEIVRDLLGGGSVRPGVHGPGRVPDLDALPPTQWELLDRYWPNAHRLGRKLQIYLARGCPYRCTFCMERAKSGYSWRPYSAERAVEEVARLATFTDLSRWVVNVADPLFGFQRRWRLEVLEGLVRRGLLPRQYWTLTRSDDLDDDDVALLAKARFSIGIGLESGSPEMLVRMQKGNKPDKYLAAVRRLAALSEKHGLTWAVNVIVGHPGETPDTMRETSDYVKSLFAGPQTRGWLSIDPFRLYPGSDVWVRRDAWAAETGAVFHHTDWWRAWYDQGFFAQHLEPSRSLSFAERVRYMHGTYRPIVAEIRQKFVGQGRDVDRVYERSIDGQLESLSLDVERATLARAEVARGVPVGRPEVRVPLGMNLKDARVRDREAAVRRLLDAGLLRSEPLVEALLDVAPEPYVGDDVARAMFEDRVPAPELEGELPRALPWTALVTALEALEVDPGSVVADAASGSGYIAALLAHLVGPGGRVVSGRVDPGAASDLPNVVVRPVTLGSVFPTLSSGDPVFERILLGFGLPRVPGVARDALTPDGRLVAFVGPRFGRQDIVAVGADRTASELRVGRARVPPLAGPHGWLAAPSAPQERASEVRFSRRPAPAFVAWLLSHLPLGEDAASTYDPSLGAPEWVEPVLAAYRAAPGRLAVHTHALPFVAIDAWKEAFAAVPAPLADPSGRALVAALLGAADVERSRFEAWFDAGRDAGGRRLVDVGAALSAPLGRLREKLYAARRAAPPPLVVVDLPTVRGTGRATSTGRERIVGLSLDQPTGFLLCQILHEEVHPITDPIVLAELGAAVDRDTRRGSPGFELHRALEETVVGATEAFLTEKSPEILPDFRRWKARYDGAFA